MSCVEESLKFFFDNIHLSDKTLGDNTILYLPKTNGVPKCLHAIRRQIIAEQKYEDRFYNHDLDDFAICINDGHSLPEHVDLIRDKENSKIGRAHV